MDLRFGDLNSLHTLLLLLCALLWWVISIKPSYHWGEKKTTQFVCRHPQEKRNAMVIDRLKSLGDYVPPWWYNHHLFALLPFSNNVRLPFQREVYFHEDGSSFVTDTYPHLSENNVDPVVCVFVPGLASTSQDSYIMNFAATLAKSNIHTIVLGTRGFENQSGGSELKSEDGSIRLNNSNSKVWHPGFHSDGLHLLDMLKKLYPKIKIFLAGYSAGSNIVQNILIHNNKRTRKNQVHVEGVFCCCVNYCYLSTMIRLEQESSWIGKCYSWMLALQIKLILRKNLDICNPDQIENYHKVRNHLEDCSMMSDFDDEIRRDVYEFESKEQQYESFSGMKIYTHMHEDFIRTEDELSKRFHSPPLLLLQPHDDPLHQGYVQDNIPINDIIEKNPNVIYMETPHGNHFGFIEGNLYEHFVTQTHTSYTFPAKVCHEFFMSILDQNETTMIYQ